MKPDDLEQKLQRQPIREIPSNWRDEILRHARAVGESAPDRTPIPSGKSALIPPSAPWWQDLLWPSPQAWAGLAAIWVVILALNRVDPEPPSTLARSGHSTFTPITVAAQQELLFQILQEIAPPPAEPPRPRPSGPRSERRLKHVAV